MSADVMHVGYDKIHDRPAFQLPQHFRQPTRTTCVVQPFGTVHSPID